MVNIRHYLPEELEDTLFTKIQLKQMGRVLIDKDSVVGIVIYKEGQMEYPLFHIDNTRELPKRVNGFCSFRLKQRTMEDILISRKNNRS